MNFFESILVFVYCFCAVGLFVMSVNCYLMLFLFKIKYKDAQKKVEGLRQRFVDEKHPLPIVTTQIPIFNEYNVGERVIRKVAEFDYPRDKHQIQVLDDSTDETQDLLKKVVEELQGEGIDIEYIHRVNRQGFKAGAMAEAMPRVKGEFIAIFDADFLPPEDFLQKTIPGFLNPKVGLVQGRWGHLNDKKSILTRIQAIGIDGHFAIEQSARDWNQLFMNFNGTAGIFRKSAIAQGGGWSADTLTEDMDLSYRMQLEGSDTCYMIDVECPAEVPEDINAFKSQQFRWAKGSIQVAKKLLPVILKSKQPLFKKYQAFMHVTHYMIHPFMLFSAILSLPIFIFCRDFSFWGLNFNVAICLILISSSAPSTLYFNAQRLLYKEDWARRLVVLPALVCIGTGLAFNNTLAVWEALIGKVSGFVRTPKKGDKESKSYKISLPLRPLFEIAIGLYCLISIPFYFASEKYIVGPFLTIYAIGFLYVGILSLKHSKFFQNLWAKFRS